MGNEYKNYHNEELQKKLDEKITSRRYGKFKPIIDDAFQRRFYEFAKFEGFDINQEVDNFIKNVKRISYDNKMPEGAAYKNNSVFGGAILINKEKMDSLTPEQKLSLFYHEITHAITDRNSKEQGLRTKTTLIDILKTQWNDALGIENQDDLNRGIALDEIFTEGTAENLTFSEDVNKFEKKGIAYTSMAFTTSLLAIAIGMPRTELLYAGNQSKEIFMQKILEQFPSEFRGEVEEKFNYFETSLDKLYEDLYINHRISQAPQRIGTVIKNIYDLANLKISTDNRAVSSNYLAELIYRNTRMEQITDYALTSLKDEKLLDDDKCEVTRGFFEDSKRQTSDLVYDLYRKNPEHTNITPEQYRLEIVAAEFDSGKQWDNSVALQFESLIENKEKTGLLNNAINSIRNLLQRYRTPKLEPAKEKQTYLPNTMEQYEVKVSGLTKEQIEEYLSERDNENESINRNGPSMDDDL